MSTNSRLPDIAGTSETLAPESGLNSPEFDWIQNLIAEYNQVVFTP